MSTSASSSAPALGATPEEPRRRSTGDDPKAIEQRRVALEARVRTFTDDLQRTLAELSASMTSLQDGTTPLLAETGAGVVSAVSLAEAAEGLVAGRDGSPPRAAAAVEGRSAF